MTVGRGFGQVATEQQIVDGRGRQHALVEPDDEHVGGVDAHRAADVDDRHGTGGVATATDRRVEQRADDLTHAWPGRTAPRCRRGRARRGRRRFARHDRRRCAATPGRRPTPARARSAHRCGRAGSSLSALAAASHVEARPTCLRLIAQSLDQLQQSVERLAVGGLPRRSAEHRVSSVAHRCRRAHGWLPRAASVRSCPVGLGDQAELAAQRSSTARRGAEHRSRRRCRAGATDSRRNTLGRSHSPTMPSTTWRRTWPAMDPRRRSTAPPDQAIPARCNSSRTGRRYAGARTDDGDVVGGHAARRSARAHWRTVWRTSSSGSGHEITRGGVDGAEGRRASSQPNACELVDQGEHRVRRGTTETTRHNGWAASRRRNGTCAGWKVSVIASTTRRPANVASSTSPSAAKRRTLVAHAEGDETLPGPNDHVDQRGPHRCRVAGQRLQCAGYDVRGAQRHRHVDQGIDRGRDGLEHRATHGGQSSLLNTEVIAASCS